MPTKVEFQTRIDAFEQKRKSLKGQYSQLEALEKEYQSTLVEMTSAVNKAELAPLMTSLSVDLAHLKDDIAEGDEEATFTVEEAPPPRTVESNLAYNQAYNKARREIEANKSSGAAAPSVGASAAAGTVNKFKDAISKPKPDEPDAPANKMK